ncbi:MAG: competence/damage-inducible protein A [Zoogloeaceae bacterium]|nr:competence/damage-inducible protein A [Zoogloeaceae bacterium]MCK6384718.1 molybdopterin-binding protein [Rhodocyclaceae bacterium]
MSIGAIIIGDEILSGKRQDKHFAKVVELLGARGMALDWAQVLGDDRVRLTAALAASLASGDIVFSFGGIGVTPDDHTRQAVAAALGVDIALHPDAEREIRARFGGETTPQRLMLGEFPLGSEIIPNPYNRIPGFSIRNHWFFPGFPIMSWPMLEWVLDTQLAHLHHAVAREEQAIVVYEAPESALLDLMNRITRDYPKAPLFSLPSFGGEGVRRHIELGVRGEPETVRQAMAEIRAAVARLGYEWQEKP